MEANAESEFLEIVSGPEEGEISEEEDECEDSTQPNCDVKDYPHKDKCSKTVIYDDRGRTTIVRGSEKNNAWPVSNYSASDRTKRREKEDEISVVKKVIVKKSIEKHTKKIRHHSKKRSKHRKHKSRSQEVDKISSKSRHNAKKSRRSRSVSVSSCTSLSSSDSGSNNSDDESSSCSCSNSRSPTPTRKRSKSMSPETKKMRGKENKHGFLSEKKLLNRLRPYSPPKPEPQVKRFSKSSQSGPSIKRSLSKQGSSRGTHRRFPLSRNEVPGNSSGSSSKSKISVGSRNGKSSSSSIIKKTRPSSISNSKITNSNKRNTSKDISKSRSDHSSKPRRKTIDSTSKSNVTVESIALPSGAAPAPGSIGEMLLKKQMKGVLRAPAPEKDEIKHSMAEDSIVHSTGSSATNECATEASALQNRGTDIGSNQDALGQDEDDILQLRLVALKSSLKVLSQVRREGKDTTNSSPLLSEIDQGEHSVIKETVCEDTHENSSAIEDGKKELLDCQSPQCEIIEEVYNIDTPPLDVLFDTALGLSPKNSPDSRWPVVNLENSSLNSQVNLECSNDTGDVDTVEISTWGSYLDDGIDKEPNQIEEIVLEPDDQNQDPVDMDICDSSPEDDEFLDEEVILEEVGEDISITSPHELNDRLGTENNDQSKFQIPVEWAYMMPPPPPPDQPENDISNFNNWCYDQNMYLQTMQQQSSYDDQQVPYDSSSQTHYQNYQKGQMDHSMTTTWQQNVSSHWNNHYDNTQGNITDNLLNIPKQTKDLNEDLLNVPNANLAHSEVTDEMHDPQEIHIDYQSSDSKDLKNTAAEYYQAFMSAMYTRQNSDSISDTLNADESEEEEMSRHVPQSQMEQQIDALLAMSRSKKNSLITVVQSQSTRGERKRRRKARMREKLQAKKAEKKTLEHQEPIDKILDINVETSAAQSTSSPVVSSPNITDDDNEDLDLLRAQLLIDLHKKRTKQEQLQEKSATSVTSVPGKAEGSAMSLEASNTKARIIVKRTVVKKHRGAQKAVTTEQSKGSSHKRNAPFKLHDIGGFSLDPKSTRFDFPVPKDMPKFKFPPVKPVVISLNPDDDTTDEEDNLPSTSSLQLSSLPSTSKETSISTGSQAINVSGNSIDELLKSFRNASVPQVSQKKKSVAQVKTKAPSKDSAVTATPNIVRHLSRNQQVEYLQLKEQIRKKEIQQRKRQLVLKQKQKTEVMKKFEAIEERLKIKKDNSSNKIIALEEKIKLAKASSKNVLPKPKTTVNSPNRIITSEVKELNDYPENADQGNLLIVTQASSIEHDISTNGNCMVDIETKDVGKTDGTVQSCNSDQVNDKLLKKNGDSLEISPEDVTKGINEELNQDVNDMDEDEDLLRLMVLQTINRRNMNSTTIPKERPASDSINTEKVSETIIENKDNTINNTNVSVQKVQISEPPIIKENDIKEENNIKSINVIHENISETKDEYIEKSEFLKYDIKVKFQNESNDCILKANETVEKTRECALKSNVTGKGAEDDTSDQDGDLILPEEWFDVDEFEDVEEGSSPSQKTFNENGSISQINSNVMSPSEDKYFKDEIENEDEGSLMTQNTSNVNISQTSSNVKSTLEDSKSNYDKKPPSKTYIKEINCNVDDIKSSCKENESSMTSDYSKELSQPLQADPMIGAIRSNMEIILPTVETVKSAETIDKKIHIEKVCNAEKILTGQFNAKEETEHLSDLVPTNERSLNDIPSIDAQKPSVVKICETLKDLNENQKEKSQSQNTNDTSFITSERNLVEKGVILDDEKSLISNEDKDNAISEPLDSHKNPSDNLNCNIDSMKICSKDVLPKNSITLEKCTETEVSMNVDSNTLVVQASLTKIKIDDNKSINVLSNISKASHSPSTSTPTITAMATTTTPDFPSRAIYKNTPIVKSKLGTPNKVVPLAGTPNKPTSIIEASNKSTVTTLNINKDSSSKNPQVVQPIRRRPLLLLKKIETDYKKRRIDMNSMISALQGLVQEATDEERQRQAMRERATALRQELQKLETQFEVSCRQVKQKMSRIKGLQSKVNVERNILAELERKAQTLGKQELGPQYRLSKVLNNPSKDKSDQTKNSQQVKIFNNHQQSLKAMPTKISSPVVHKTVPNQQKGVLLKNNSLVGKGTLLSKSQDSLSKSQESMKTIGVKIPDSCQINTAQKSVASNKTANLASDNAIKITQKNNLSDNVAASKIVKIIPSDNNKASSLSGDVNQEKISIVGVNIEKNQKNEITKRNMSEKRKDSPDSNYSIKGAKLKTNSTLNDSNKEDNKVNEMDVMCPYDLMGRCNDDSCPYLHLKTDHKKATCIESPAAKNVGKKSTVNLGNAISTVTNVTNVHKQLSTDTLNMKQPTTNVEGSDAKDLQINSEPKFKQNSAKYESEHIVNTITNKNMLNCEKSNNEEVLETEEIPESSCTMYSLDTETLNIKNAESKTFHPLLDSIKRTLTVKRVFGVTKSRSESFVKSNTCESIKISAVDDNSEKNPLKSKVMEVDMSESNSKGNANVETNVKKGNDCNDESRFDLIDNIADSFTQSNSNLVNENSDILKPVIDSIELEQDKVKETDNKVPHVSEIMDSNSPDLESGTNESLTLRVSGRKRSSPTNNNTESPRRGRSGARGRGRGSVRERSGSSTRSSSSTRSQNDSCSRERGASPLPAKILKKPSKQSKVSKESTKVTRDVGQGRRGKTSPRKGKRKEQ